ncbi:MAG: HAD-IB family phosphatase [Gemmatimonadaceae bacterium]
MTAELSGREDVRSGVPSPWAVVCDFDGTAIMGDIADALALRYLGPTQFELVNAQFKRGDITFRELLHKLFEPIAATPLEIRASAQALADFRPGFVRLVELSRERNIPFTLASGGLDIYITPALELLSAAQRGWMTLRANHATHRDGGLDLSFPYADQPGSCGECGSCKRAVITELQNDGYRVLAIGDGHADRCMADAADVLFARARLREWCDEVQKPYIAFETLDVVVDFLESNCADMGLQ